MKLHSPLSVLAICLCCAAGVLAKDTTRSATRDDEDLRYVQRHAFVVGINYDGSNVVKILQNAEGDAKEIAEILESQYDFDCELMVGAAATKEAIVNRLLKYRDEVKERDCFLFYFAGHGKKQGSFGYIFPSDVVAKNGQPDTLRSGVKHTDIIAYVEDLKARHRLIILDSCFSGQLLQHLETSRGAPTDAAATSIDRGLFDARCLQALTAGASDEEVPDSERNSAHSPFQQALVTELEARPGDKTRSFFTATSLAHKVTLNLQNGKQSPQFSYSEKQGEFHFFPVGPGSVTKVATATFYQTLPGTPGEWWFDEMPWLTPRTRLWLDENPERLYLPDNVGEDPPHAGLPDPSDFSVYTALRKSIEELSSKSRRSTQPLQFHGLLGLRGKRDRAEDGNDPDKQKTEDLLEGVLATLPPVSDASSATDLHLRALILHKQGHEGATAAYESAIANYGDQPTGLKLRCRADFGKWCTDQRAFNRAREVFETALAELPIEEADNKDVSPFFRVELLCGLAYAHRKLGNWETAENYYKEKVGKLLDEEQVAPQHPVRAFLAERCAWNLMDQWHVEDALKCLTHAGSIRTAWLEENKQQDTADYFNMKLSQVKVKHGLAVAARLSGHSPAATYKEIQVNLRTEIDQARALSQKRALVAQFVNTTERLGDYYLFQGRIAADSAVNLYRDALDQVDETEPSTYASTKETLLCKLAMAAMLAADRSGLTDAAEGLDELDKLSSPKDDMEPPADVETRNEKQGTLVRQLADIFQALAKAETRQRGLDELRTLVRQNASKKDDRDDQELLLLAARTLTDEQQSEDALTLAALLSEKPKAEQVLFYRPHYDRVIEQRAGFVSSKEDMIALAKLVQKVKNQKEFRPSRNDSLVIYYFPRSGGNANVIVLISLQREFMVRRLDFGIQDVDQLTPDEITSVNEKLSEMPIPDGAQVFWDDDTLLKQQLPEYPFSVPRQPRLNRLLK